jgi:hypothetical protein
MASTHSAPSAQPRWSRPATAAIAIALVGLFHLSTIRDGQGWGDDFAQYIMHAKNIATGQPYSPTGYLVNPAYEALGPVAYPPVTGFILAPAYARSGLDFRPMKVEMVALLLVALAAIYLLFRSGLPPPLMALLLLAIGFNPFISELKDNITSDMAFLAICTLGLAASEWVMRPGRSRQASLTLGVLLGLGLYLATGTRSAGIALVAAVPVYALITRRREAIVAAGAAVAVAGALMAVQRVLLPFEGAYWSWFQETFSWTAPIAYARAYAGELRSLVANGYNAPASTLVFFLLLGLGVVGAASSLRRGIGIADVFLVLYGGMILLFEATLRYALPIVPILLFYAIYGVSTIRAWLPRSLAWAPAVLVATVLAASYAGKYTRMGFGTLEDGATQPAFMELAAFIRTNTRPDDRFIFRKPRALALFAERSTTPYEPATDAASLAALAKAVGASYLVAANLEDEQFASERTVIAPILAAHPERFERVYGNARFTLYRLQ